MVTIEVTAGDIKAARKDKKGCPIEIAAGRAFKAHVTGIGVESIYVANRQNQIYDLPAEAQKLAEDFDAGMKVEPLIFNIDNAY